jgi:ABC-type dipeptide/oligopeptide/nickel transport system permease component
VLQAVRRNKVVDHFFNGFSTVFYAMPAFLLGILLILVFAIKFPIFPPEGPQGEGVAVLFTNFNALVLPIVSLTLITIALFSRYMRSSVLDNLTEDYVRTAKAKGASERRVLLRHVLRNSLIPIGVLQAVRRNRIVDHFFNGFSTIFYAMPAFLLGILLILIFAIKFPLFPPEGPQGEGVAVLFTDFNALILPIASLTLITIALFSRYMRSSVLDNLTEDYVRTAKAKGASERRVLLRHVLRNSLIPIATLLGLLLPAVFAGALITESVFNYPGMGYLFFQSALNQDYPVLLGITVVVAVATVVGSLLADIAYAVLDPRVRYVSQ